MKKRFSFANLLAVCLLLLLLLLPVMAAAHTGLESSDPANEQKVTSDISQIKLEFETRIEQLSKVEVIRDDRDTIRVQKEIAGKVMTANTDGPLENGSYQVNWSIVGVDGHPVQGSFRFTVNKPDISAGQPPTPSGTDQNIEDDNDQTAAPGSSQADTGQPAGSAQTGEKDESGGLSLGYLIAFWVIIAIVVIYFIVLFVRKKPENK